jgi:hypothetical protein
LWSTTEAKLVRISAHRGLADRFHEVIVGLTVPRPNQEHLVLGNPNEGFHLCFLYGAFADVEVFWIITFRLAFDSGGRETGYL